VKTQFQRYINGWKEITWWISDLAKSKNKRKRLRQTLSTEEVQESAQNAETSYIDTRQ